MTITTAQLAPFFKEINTKADKVTNYYLLGNFIFGLYLASFYNTWMIAFVVGGINLLMYYAARFILPTFSLYQYIGSAVSGIFVAQYIYQMHGMFEMHFFVFVASLIMVAYHNWKLQLPLFILLVVHHASFAWLQYSGMKDIYFTQLDYMTLQTFIFHNGLAALIVFLCGYWSHDFRKKTIEGAMNTIMQDEQLSNMSKNVAFAEELIKGNLEVELEADENDELARSMITMKKELQKSRQREQEDRFTNTGIARVSDVLRNNMNDVQSLCDQVILSLVKYVEANQGGFFILEGEEDNDLHLKLRSHYAYNRKKFREKRVEPGEGLVGQAYLEKESSYRTEIPRNYVTITSGLGEATPTSLLVIPLKYNEKVVGVLEFASFREFKDYEIAFLEKVAESIASTILSVQVNQRTNKLLQEANEQAGLLQSQEEEMRQNMEELSATQEEMYRTELELQQKLTEATTREEELMQQLESLKHELQK